MAKPIDLTPEEKRELKRTRNRAAVRRWRQRHPDTARALARHCMALWRLAKRYREERARMRAAA